MISFIYDSGIWGETVASLESICKEKQDIFQEEVRKRSETVADEMQKQLEQLISGSGGGRIYSLGGGLKYRASAPGAVPAKRTGGLVSSYFPKKEMEKGSGGVVFRSGTESSYRTGSYLLADLLEHGTSTMSPRPYREKVVESVLPYALRLYSLPYEG